MPSIVYSWKKDTLIPYEHTQILYAKCAAKVKEMELPEEADHNCFDLDNDIINPIGNLLNEKCLRSTTALIVRLDKNLFNVSEYAAKKKIKEPSTGSSSPFRSVKNLTKASISSSKKVANAISGSSSLSSDDI